MLQQQPHCLAIEISIHSPLTGRDLPSYLSIMLLLQFQSTLPSRGETFICWLISTVDGTFQSTLPSRGETPGLRTRQKGGNHISIHSPLTGRDLRNSYYTRRKPHFNPLSPHGERPAGQTHNKSRRRISIHSPLTGRDIYHNCCSVNIIDFNPLSPHGERHPYCKCL